ncbi:MAG: hypothetical protein ACP5KZ_03610, partial [bacterium]
MILLIALIFAPLGVQFAHPLKIEKIAVNPVLPCRGEKMIFRAILHNETSSPVRDITLSLYLKKGRKETRLREIKISELKSGERKRLELGEWTGKESGLYDLVLSIDTKEGKISKALRFAIVEKKVDFAWYGTPKGLRWPTICTTTKEDEIDEWLWEGRVPLVFKPGVCFWEKHPTAKIEEQASCWANIPNGAEGIGIDEYGAGKAGEKVKEAIRMFKLKNPILKIALWTTGGDEEELIQWVDYLLPELYLNYHGMHLGILKEALERIKKGKWERKVLPGLGINHEPEHGTLLTTPEELEAQFRLIKSFCPDIRGVAVFYFGSVGKLDKLCDELFYRYFILPVYEYDWEIRKEGGNLAIKSVVKNIGNMDGEDITGFLYLDEKMEKRVPIGKLRAGQEKIFSIPISGLKKGFHTVRLKIASQGEGTVLDNEKEEIIGVDIETKEKGKEVVLWLPPASYKRDNPPLRYKLPQGWHSARVILLNEKGEAIKEIPCQINSEGEVVWLGGEIPEGEKQFYSLTPKEGKSSPSLLNNGDVFTFKNDFYQAKIDLNSDCLSELLVGGENILASPWRLELHPVANFRILREKITLNEGDVLSELTIPFESDEFEGETRYIFYRESPIIEIRRRLNPKREIVLEGAREGASFPQRGGYFQAFPGEGALRISKGRLFNSNEYRDIYFGYLGASPSPTNNEKVGWFDFLWDEPPVGLGIAVLKRWIDSKSRTYDVTRYYDGGDWADIFYVFQTEAIIKRPQESVVLLMPHKFCDLEKEDAPIMPIYLTERTRLR